jgi:hypothetical protein
VVLSAETLDAALRASAKVVRDKRRRSGDAQVAHAVGGMLLVLLTGHYSNLPDLQFRGGTRDCEGFSSYSFSLVGRAEVSS